MKKSNLIKTGIILSVSLLLCGCTLNKPVEEIETDEVDASIETQVEPIIDTTDSSDNTLDEDPYYDADLPDDIVLGYAGEDEEPQVGAFCANLDVLNHLKDPFLFRNDLNDFVKYFFPNADRLYDTYVIEGTETYRSGDHEFKIRIEGIMEDGSDLEVKVLRLSGYPMYDFFSDVSPDGTVRRVDQSGNPVDWTK